LNVGNNNSGGGARNGGDAGWMVAAAARRSSRGAPRHMRRRAAAPVTAWAQPPSSSSSSSSQKNAIALANRSKKDSDAARKHLGPKDTALDKASRKSNSNSETSDSASSAPPSSFAAAASTAAVAFNSLPPATAAAAGFGAGVVVTGALTLAAMRMKTNQSQSSSSPGSDGPNRNDNAATQSGGATSSSSVKAELTRMLGFSSGAGKTNAEGDEEDSKWPVMRRRYAEQIADAPSHVKMLPRGIELGLYAEVIKIFVCGAMLSLFANFKQADILGHPVVLNHDTNWKHTPATPEVTPEEVERFVHDILDGACDERLLEAGRGGGGGGAGISGGSAGGGGLSGRLGGDGGEEFGAPPNLKDENVKEMKNAGTRNWGSNVGGIVLPWRAEMEIYRNALLTGIYVVEDTLKSFKVRLFNSEYTFEIGAAARADWVCNKAHPKLSYDELLKLAREELKLPAIAKLAPGIEANLGRLALALAGEVVGSIEFVFLGHALRFSLQPKVERCKLNPGRASTTINFEC